MRIGGASSLKGDGGTARADSPIPKYSVSHTGRQAESLFAAHRSKMYTEDDLSQQHSTRRCPGDQNGSPTKPQLRPLTTFPDGLAARDLNCGDAIALLRGQTSAVTTMELAVAAPVAGSVRAPCGTRD